jgi:DNA-binding NarL/FixJ family response regulator
MTEVVRLVIADDHPVFREGLRRLLDLEPDFQLVGEAQTGGEALRVVTAQDPDVLLLDFGLPDMSGVDVLRSLVASRTRARTVFVTAVMDTPQVIEALRLGARGLVLKTSASSLIPKCVRAVMAGEYWFGHDRLQDVFEALQRIDAPSSATPVEKLTRRELEIIAAVLNGAGNRDIAHQFGLSEQTVKNHLSHIFDKVGVSNRLELALFAIHHRLLDRLKR